MNCRQYQQGICNFGHDTQGGYNGQNNGPNLPQDYNTGGGMGRGSNFNNGGRGGRGGRGGGSYGDNHKYQPQLNPNYPQNNKPYHNNQQNPNQQPKLNDPIQ